MKFDFTFNYKISHSLDITYQYGVVVTSLQYETFKVYVKPPGNENFRLDSTPNIIHIRCVGKEWSDAFLRAYSLYLIENTILNSTDTKKQRETN